MKYILAKIRFGWGFAARLQPQSKMRMAFKYPPPTTLLGALAYPLLRSELGRVEVVSISRGRRKYELVSSADLLRKRLLELAASVKGEHVIYGDYLKINRFYRRTVDSGVTALPASFSYSSDDKGMDVVYLFDGIDEDLERAAWGITRIGSRESAVWVEEVRVGEARELRGDSTTTRFSFFLRDGLNVEGNGVIIYAVDWMSSPIGNYGKVQRLPYFYPRGEVRVKGNISWYELDMPEGREVVINSHP